jgi:hypothetical protein
MNKAVVHICALCWLFLLRLIMHGTNINLYRICMFNRLEIRNNINFLKSFVIINHLTPNDL